ncbi:MAG: AMP-binding protein, partial [Sphingomonadaceae bacterium]|nr:AMP-binding protein [Sphingomonadaceae bacterium]
MDIDSILEAETLADIIRQHGTAQPETVAFTFGAEEITFGELDAGSNRAAQGLAALGVTKGERIAYLGKNHPLYFEVLLAAAKLGAVMTPVNWRLAPPEVAYILDDCQARVVFVGEGFAGMIDQVRTDVPRLEHVIGIDAGDGTATDYRQWRDQNPPSDPQVPLSHGDDLLQLYTSGTTGRPKGAVMTNGSILSSRDAAGREGLLRPWQEPVEGDVTLLAMPCFHISGTGT